MYGATAVDRGIADSRGQRLSDGRWFAPPASTQVFPLAGKGLTAFPANPVNPVILSKKKNRGFTLVELMVAMAIFAVLMAGVTMIFMGSLRTTQTGYQQMDAFERARTALNLIEDDLVRGFSSHQSADVHNFYGTPIGMTFIGVMTATSEPKDVNVARITYVVYNPFRYLSQYASCYQSCPRPSSGQMLDIGEAWEYRPYVYPVLRYVQPNVGDLESFPFNLGDALPGGSQRTYGNVLRDLCQYALNDPDFDYTRPDLSPRQEATVRAKKCEMWIRMLAGGDQWRPPDLPSNLDVSLPVDFWWDILGGGCPSGPSNCPDPLYRDYVITENVVSFVPPEQRYAAPFDVDPYKDNPCEKHYFFYYRCTPRTTDTPLADTQYCDNPGEMPPRRCFWWPISRLPEVVQVTLRLGFSSPYPGAPDFDRTFTLEIQLPTGYTRTVNPDLGE